MGKLCLVTIGIMSGRIEKLKDSVQKIPNLPGVYFFKDEEGKILYIGKAKSLKKRVQSYFYRRLDAKTQILLSKTQTLDYQPVSTESQAQLLEASLIKKFQPQYNLELKDDKSFPWVRISKEKFPVVSIFRRKEIDPQDESFYFGPYTNVRLLRDALKLLRRVFGFRSCRIMPPRPCLYYRIRLCPAPCAGKISVQEYNLLIERIKLFLEGSHGKLVEKLSLAMQEAAGKKRFEEAARLRDQIKAIGAFNPGAVLEGKTEALDSLKKILKLEKIPLRIEAFDISNIFGQEACGSMVSFYRGFPDKGNYRRFRIKGVHKIDDYQMIKEIVRRRYTRLQNEHKEFPDLIVIDGGRAHVLAAKEQLDRLGIDIPILGMAKEKENIYILNKKTPLRLPEGSLALNLIRRIRDEAHRFALKYHHLLRRKKVFRQKKIN